MDQSFEQFDFYRKQYTNNTSYKQYCSIDQLLRVWKQQKGIMLSKLFGNNLILEKHFAYRRSPEEVSSMLDDMINDFRVNRREIFESLRVALGVRDNWYWEYDPNGSALDFVQRMFSSDHLQSNIVSGVEILSGKPSYTYNINGQKVTVQNGMKVTRFLGQIAKAVDKTEAWEAVREKHAQITSENKITGTLCLSIHPLDFATASDNANGWSSCMSWEQEGCYRMGTVEMMNSPIVICAYIKSKNAEMDIDGTAWNSKKWRAWIIVTPDLIMCNKQYPIFNNEVAMAAIDWVRDLVKEAYGWTYGEIMEDVLFESDKGDDKDMNSVEFSLLTNYMYNDVDCNRSSMIGCYAFPHTNNWTGTYKELGIRYVKRTSTNSYLVSICYSGPSQCMICGRVIDKDENGMDSDRLECPDCHEEIYCADCGERLDPEDAYEYNGQYYCESCYHDHFEECVMCSETYDRDDISETPNVWYSKNFIDKWFEKATKTHISTIIHNVAHLQAHYAWLRELNVNDTNSIGFICNDCLRQHHIEKTWSTYYDNYAVDPKATKLNDFLYVYCMPGRQFVTGETNGWYPYYSREDEQHAEEISKFFNEFYNAFWAEWTKTYEAHIDE